MSRPYFEIMVVDESTGCDRCPQPMKFIVTKYTAPPTGPDRQMVDWIFLCESCTLDMEVNE